MAQGENYACRAGEASEWRTLLNSTAIVLWLRTDFSASFILIGHVATKKLCEQPLTPTTTPPAPLPNPLPSCSVVVESSFRK